MVTERIEFLGLPLNTGLTHGDVCALMQKKDGLRLVAFLNPASFALAKRNEEYRRALDEIPFLLPDSEGLALAARLLNGKPCQRISFEISSLADPFFKAAIANQATLMLVGGDPGVDENVQEKLKVAYPGLRIIGTQHGFGELPPKVTAIVAKAPDVVIIGMGAPRQEFFLLALRAAGYKGMAITCGGFFDAYLAEAYYPAWVERFHLRFAWWLLKEPRRLWRRYLVDYQLFFWRFLKAAWNKLWPQAKTAVDDALAKMRRD